MNLLEIFLIGIGLSMDAFAVSVGKGLGMGRIEYRTALLLAVSFGFFQALMPVIGWFLAAQFADVIRSFDHWIAFILLAIVGGKMIVDAIRGTGEDEDVGSGPSIGVGELLVLSVATSIDALAVGIMFAALGVSPMPAVVIIGVTTFTLSCAGVVLGNRFGAVYERPANLLGGVILVAIGLKVLIEHLTTGV